MFNDPTSGSPTVTLLRLLLPLNAQVWGSSRTTQSARTDRGPVQMPHQNGTQHTQNITTLSITIKNMTLSITKIKNAQCHFYCVKIAPIMLSVAISHYADCRNMVHYAECRNVAHYPGCCFLALFRVAVPLQCNL